MSIDTVKKGLRTMGTNVFSQIEDRHLDGQSVKKTKGAHNEPAKVKGTPSPIARRA